MESVNWCLKRKPGAARNEQTKQSSQLSPSDARGIAGIIYGSTRPTYNFPLHPAATAAADTSNFCIIIIIASIITTAAAIEDDLPRYEYLAQVRDSAILNAGAGELHDAARKSLKHVEVGVFHCPRVKKRC